MSEYVIQGQTLSGIADAIRAQLGTEQQYTPESMAAAIESIQGGMSIDAIIDGSVSGDLTIGVTSVKPYGISHIDNPLRLYLPNCTDLSASNAIASNSNLTCICFDKVTKIGILSLGSNSTLSAVIIRSSSIPAVQINSFNGTPIVSGTGYIYVPDNLVDEYKAATNWAVYAAQIKGLSEIPAEVQEWLDQQGGASA